MQKMAKILWLIPFLVYGCAIKSPPEVDIKSAGDAITSAREAIAVARDEKASENAPQELARAEHLLESAQDALRKGQTRSALELALQADTEGRIASALAREANAKYRAEKTKELINELLWETKENEIAIAKARQAIAERLALEAQKYSEISGEQADKRIQKAEAELAIAKAEVTIRFAEAMSAPKYAQDSYNSANSSLQEARSALAEEDFQKAETSAKTAERHAENAVIQAKAKSKAETEEMMRKRDQAMVAITKAEVAVEESALSQAEEYAKDLYEDSKKTLQSARSALEKEEYDQASTLAERAKVSAVSARAVAQAKKKEEETKERIEEAKANALDAIAKAERNLSEAYRSKASELSSDIYNQAQAELEQARQAMLDKDFEKALLMAQESVFNSTVALAEVKAINERKRKVEEIEKDMIEEANRIPDIAVRTTEKGVIISIESDIFARFGGIKKDVLPRLKMIADLLKRYPGYRIIIEGHTDNTGSPESNLKISSERANNLLRYLADAEGISLDRLSSVGYGGLKPIADNTDEDSRRLNRRIDILILTR